VRLLRIKICNFRNFRAIDCRLGGHVVLLGENGSGKSNLLHALRLVLDADLPDTGRYLTQEDFWEGGVAFQGTEILVSVDLTDYQGEAPVLACLADHEIKPPAGWSQSVARITYRYAPRATLPPSKRASSRKEDYDFKIYGRDDQSNTVGHEVRRYLGFRVLNALRDAEGDLRAWRRSPLRPLLEDARDKLDVAALANVVNQIDAASNEITSEKPLGALESAIRDRLNEMLGHQHVLSPTFGFAATDPRQLVQSLRLFMDDKRSRGVADTSLGLANVLYLSLLLLRAEQQVLKGDTATTVLGIEEPEAHLHPQMQRVVFRDLLARKLPVIVSTHSPNIASVSPVDALAVLRKSKNESTIATVAATRFTPQERADLSHYLDVTRAEILFGRGIVLVEGDAERFVVPAAAGLLSHPVRLDEFGISVCSVVGTDFVPYARLLSGLNIDYVIITDGDEKDAATTWPGINRGRAVLASIDNPSAQAVDDFVTSGQPNKARKLLAKEGIFVGRRTLEADILEAGGGPRLKETFKIINPASRDATAVPFDATGPISDASEKAAVVLAERCGKGRFAQTLATRLKTDDVPEYISMALEYLINKCKHA
jgi:putative ATP-dependent endonuclease of the OLD family